MSAPAPRRDHPTRRALLVGGSAALGLVLAWELWPREYRPNLRAAPGETVLGAFLTIDTAGRVTVVVPQAELGQGITTALPQALADELGAAWRQVAVEPAPLNPLYANRLLAGEWAEGEAPAFLRPVAGWAAGRWATASLKWRTASATLFSPRKRPPSASLSSGVSPCFLRGLSVASSAVGWATANRSAMVLKSIGI